MSSVTDPMTTLDGNSSRLSWLSVLAYFLSLAAGVIGFYWIESLGQHLPQDQSTAVRVLAPTEGGVIEGTSKPINVVMHVLATLSAVILLGFVLGRWLRFLGQPPVIGEVLAGICLGPSLLGAIAPQGMHLLIPDAAVDPDRQVLSALQMIAQLGVLLYMFVVGLELNAAAIKRRVNTAIAVSHASKVLPFLMGALLALWLYPRYSPPGVSFASFCLFVGVAMSITAFPVLARILTDRGLNKTQLGIVALAAAAADDLMAWCLLALVVGIVQSSVDSAAFVALGSVAFIAFMLLVARPLAGAWCRRIDNHSGPIPMTAFVIALAAVLLAGLTTETIGIHAIFGGFLLGAIIPHDSRFAHELNLRLTDLVTILLLPAFFALTGMRTEIGLVSGMEHWIFCLVIILVATLGKFGGTFAAATATGSDWREASALGVLMNTRGLMELIVLNIGLDLGLISPTLFAMMVIMALVTTMITSPALAVLVGRHRRAVAS